MAEVVSQQGGTFYKEGQYAKYALDKLLLMLVLTISNLPGRKNVMKQCAAITTDTN